MMAFTDDQPFRVAIVGGGIGGLFCALSIHHHGCKAGVPMRIDVYEQASQYKEIGAGVGIGVNAAKWFHALDMGDKLNAIASLPSGIWISFRRYDNSDDVVTIPIKDNQEIRQAPCARTDLLDILRQTIEERKAATLHTKKTCQSVEDRGKSIRIHFKDGLQADADVLIGCDGIHSTVRSLFTEDKPMYSGQIAYRGVIPIASLKNWQFESYSVLWMAKHKHLLVFPISRDTELNIVAFVTKSEREVADVKESWTAVCDRKDVEEDFKHFDNPVQEIISLMPAKPSKWRLNDRELLHRWHYMGGKVILLGDAARKYPTFLLTFPMVKDQRECQSRNLLPKRSDFLERLPTCPNKALLRLTDAMLPHLGAGAGQAVEDGWVLGRALGDYLRPNTKPIFPSLEDAAQFYQDVRLPRAQKTQATSRIAGDTYEMQTQGLAHKTFEECLPIIAERTVERMKWVWGEDLDQRYEAMKERQEA